MIIILIFLTLSLSALAEPACACGWWGDGEMSLNDDVLRTQDGLPVETTLSLSTIKLPGKMGYGIAVSEPGQAIPYLLATSGQPVYRIADFKIFDFRSVIDLGTPETTAQLHRSETEAAKLQYFNIPVTGNMPNQKQTDIFNNIIVNTHNRPLLVYAPRTELLGVMWVLYRLNLGSPLEFSIKEGRSLGLTKEQEIKLRN